MAAMAILVLSFSWLLSAPATVTAKNRIALDIVLLFDYVAKDGFEVYSSTIPQLVTSLSLRDSNSRLCFVPFGREPKPLLNWTTNPDEVNQLVERLWNSYPDPGPPVLRKALDAAFALMEYTERDETKVKKVLIIVTLDNARQENGQEDASIGDYDWIRLRKLGYVLFAFFPIAGTEINRPTDRFIMNVAEPNHFFKYDRTKENPTQALIPVFTKEIPEQLLKSICQRGRQVHFCRYTDEFQSACIPVFHYETRFYDDCFLHYKTDEKPDDCEYGACDDGCEYYWRWKRDCTDIQYRNGPNPLPKLLENCPLTRPCPNATKPTPPSEETAKPKPKPKPGEEETDEQEPEPRTPTPRPKAGQAESKAYIYLIVGLVSGAAVVVVALCCAVCCCMKSTGKDGLTIVQRWRKRRRDRIDRRRSNDRRNVRDLSRRAPPRRNDRRQSSIRQQPRLPDRSGSFRDRDRFGGGDRGRVPDRSDRNRGSDRFPDRSGRSRGPDRGRDWDRDRRRQSVSGIDYRRR